MKPNVKHKLLTHADNLISEGEKLLSQKKTYKSLGTDYVDNRGLQKWLTGIQHFAERIGPPARVWQSTFNEQVQGHLAASVSHLLGPLESLKEAIENDLLTNLETLISAEAFGNILEQASELIDKGYVLAAGVLGRAVLEEHLRKLCENASCLPPGRPTINDLNQALYKTNVLDKLAMQNVTAMATAGNHCAHNNQPPLSETDIRTFLTNVTDFLIRHPLS